LLINNHNHKYQITFTLEGSYLYRDKEIEGWEVHSGGGLVLNWIFVNEDNNKPYYVTKYHISTYKYYSVYTLTVQLILNLKELKYGNK